MSISTSEIQQYGGKGAMLRAMQAEGVPNIPQFVIKQAGEDIPKIPFGGVRMVRSSSPAEDGIASLQADDNLTSFAGLFHSESCSLDGHLASAVERVEGSIANPHAIAYAQKHGVEIPTDMPVIIQSKEGYFNGSVTRNPGWDDQLYISVTSGQGLERDSWDFSYARGTFHSPDFGLSEHPFAEKHREELMEIIRIFEEAEELPCVDNRFAYQMEFSMDPIAVLQLRPFRKKARADFRLPEIKDDSIVYKDARAIGVTPEEGIQLPVVRGMHVLNAEMIIDTFMDRKNEMHPAIWHYSNFLSPLMNRIYVEKVFMKKHKDLAEIRGIVTQMLDNEDHYRMNERKDSSLAGPYAFVVDKINRNGPQDTVLRNMRAFVDFQSGDIMSHNGFRMMQDTEVSLLFNRVMGKKMGASFFHPIFNTNNWSTVRIISNGSTGRIIQEKFAEYGDDEDNLERRFGELTI